MRISRSALVGVVAAHAAKTALGSSYWGQNPSAAGYNPAQQQQQQEYYGQQQQHQYGENSPVSDRKPPLPPGWVEFFDPSSGMPYYFNENDGTTTWDRPAASEESISAPPEETLMDDEHAPDADATDEYTEESQESFPKETDENNSSTESSPEDEIQAGLTDPRELQQQQQQQQPSEGRSGETSFGVLEGRFNQTSDGNADYERKADLAPDEPPRGWGVPEQRLPFVPTGQQKPLPEQQQHPAQGPDSDESRMASHRQQDRMGIPNSDGRPPVIDRPPQDRPPVIDRPPQDRPPVIDRPPQDRPPTEYNRPPQDRPLQGNRPAFDTQQPREELSPWGARLGHVPPAKDRKPDGPQSGPPGLPHRSPPRDEQQQQQPPQQQPPQQQPPQQQPPQQQPPQQQPPQQNRFTPPLQPGGMPPQAGRGPLGQPGQRQESDLRSVQQRAPPQQQQGSSQQQHQMPPRLQQQQPPPQQQQRQIPPPGYPNQPHLHQQAHYGQYGQQQQRGPPQPQGQYYSQYSQYGQYQGYGRQPPQPRNQLIPAETTEAVQGALTNAWQGILGFGNRTKEAVSTARSSVVETAKEAGQTISSRSTTWWGSAKNVLGNFFEAGPDDMSNEYSLSGSAPPQQMGNPPGRVPPGYPQQGRQGYPGQGYPSQGYPPQGQRAYPPQGQQQDYPPQQAYPPRVPPPGYPQQGLAPPSSQGLPRQPGQPPENPSGQRYPPSGYGQTQQPPPGQGPPQPRWDPPNPNVAQPPNAQRPPYPPVQSQWEQYGQTTPPIAGGQYPARPNQGGPPPMRPPPPQADGEEKKSSDPWFHPGLSEF